VQQMLQTPSRMKRDTVLCPARIAATPSNVRLLRHARFSRRTTSSSDEVSTAAGRGEPFSPMARMPHRHVANQRTVGTNERLGHDDPLRENREREANIGGIA
jgi:hypothetical protein